MTPQNELKKGQKVRVVLEGTILNPIYNYKGELDGYRITDGVFWSVVPAEAVKEIK